MPFSKIYSHLLSFSFMTLIAHQAYAQTTHEHTIVTPSCLIKQLQQPYAILAKKNDLNLINVSENDIISLAQKKHIARCGGFIDVTDRWERMQTEKNAGELLLSHYNQSHLPLVATNYKIQYEKTVNPLLNTINPQDIWTDLTTLTSFHDRFAKSDNGVKAASWISSQVENLAKENNRQDVTIYTVPTGKYYKQPSVVVKLGNSNEPGIVIGGHIDTVLESGKAAYPGADDDGSGSITVLETARVLLASGLHFKHPIYFIWYAAEEEGLVGSTHVVADFKAKKIPVAAVMQLDMTGYRYKNKPTMWLMTDNSDPALTNYLETLINTYVKQPVSRSRCGYACSDHASWYHEGYSASIPFESHMDTYNPDIHSPEDTMDKLSLDHMTNFTKLAIAFSVELAEPLQS